MTWRVRIFLLALSHVAATLVLELFLYPFIHRYIKRKHPALYTNTVFGKGGVELTGAKPFHQLRRAFEDHWRPSFNSANGLPSRRSTVAPTYSASSMLMPKNSVGMTAGSQDHRYESVATASSAE